MSRIFPHPYLSALTLLTWCFLSNSISAGTVVFAMIVAVAIPMLTAAYWPDRPRLGSPFVVLKYALVVLLDIVKANIEVAMIILFKRNADLRPAWVSVPLELTSPEAITVLAGTVTLTPGTVSCDLSTNGKALLVHCLHAPDPQSVVEEIKRRYEAPLKKIFREETADAASQEILK